MQEERRECQAMTFFGLVSLFTGIWTGDESQVIFFASIRSVIYELDLDVVVESWWMEKAVLHWANGPPYLFYEIKRGERRESKVSYSKAFSGICGFGAQMLLSKDAEHAPILSIDQSYVSLELSFTLLPSSDFQGIARLNLYFIPQ